MLNRFQLSIEETYLEYFIFLIERVHIICSRFTIQYFLALTDNNEIIDLFIALFISFANLCDIKSCLQRLNFLLLL